MGKINVLGFDIANLIAAGEVVDRPASVVKELSENSIDAGARAVTIEIRHGGTTFIRISDNGCGIDPDDMPLTVLRHATSKIKTAEDLASIGTLGFRGEALAAISAVCHLQMISRTRECPYGTSMECEAGEVKAMNETGSALGTSVIVRDLFYNVPARRKFLKKDATETAAVTAVVEKLALSSPKIAIKYICDGVVRFMTSGDGDLQGAIFSVFGRDTAKRTLAVDRTDSNGIRVKGYVSEPDMLRSNRNSENFFINGRFVKSKTAMAALEQAYATRIPHEKFPFAVLNIELNPEAVDVNVHPSKLEVKFANERIIFEAVYYAILTALESAEKRPELTYMPSEAAPVAETKIPEKLVQNNSSQIRAVPKPSADFFAVGEKARAAVAAFVPQVRTPEEKPQKAQLKIEEEIKAVPRAEEMTVPEYIICGEVYNCYVIVQLEDRMLIIDKHAAHERILFDELCRRMNEKEKHAQILMFAMNIRLSELEASAVEEYKDKIKALGFAFTINHEKSCISVTEVPEEIGREAAEDMLRELAHRLSEGVGTVEATQAKFFEAGLYQASCKAAIKGGRVYSTEHIRWICDRLLMKPDENGAVIKTCPHGRPVAFEIKKTSIERQFNRLT